MMFCLVAGALGVFLFGACSSEVKSVEYYKEHKDERLEKLKACAKLKREDRAKDEECHNALMAIEL